MAVSFSGTDFHAVKLANEKEIRVLESKLPLVTMQAKKAENNLTVLFSNLKLALDTYRTQNIKGKRKLISSIFSENLVFDGSQNRISRPNEIKSITTLFTSKLNKKKVIKI